MGQRSRNRANPAEGGTSNGGFGMETVTRRFGLNEPPDRDERSVLIRDKVRHEAFPTGLPCSVTWALRLFG